MSDTFFVIFGFSIVFIATALGAALVFFVGDGYAEKKSRRFLGVAGGIMVSASIFSLLEPSIEGFSRYGVWKFLPTAVCFLLGGSFFFVTDKLVHKMLKKRSLDGKTHGRSIKPERMFTAMTIHNIPEGLAVGFAFGSALMAGGESMVGALALAIGIAVQNFPEGAAVSIPMRAKGKSKSAAFVLGALSGIVEPIAATFGLIFSTSIAVTLPFVMAFAAGTMIFVVVEDMLPSAENGKGVTWGFMLGFALMMALDLAL